MESLYRKYRPLTFESVVGQQHIVSTLEHAVTEGRLSHAYLFCGPRGTGKTTMARILAKALLCEGAAGAAPGYGCMPDGSCPECEAIAAGTHPDVYELDAASRTGVDNVREEIVNSVSFAPVRGKYKVYIIDEVHMLTTAAFNALLKTLEEPPAHVVFVLCTTDPQKILETILSRCQRFDFHRISNEDIVGRLRYICEQEGFEYDAEALDIVAKHARGGMRDALSTLEQLSVFGNGAVRVADARSLLGEVAGTVLAEFAAGIAQRDVVELFGLVRAQVDGGNDLMELTRDLVAHLRDLYTVRVAGAAPELVDGTPEEVAAMGEEAAAFETADRLARCLTVLDDAALEMRAAADVRLVLEIALTRLARPESDLTLEALAERLDRLEAQIAAGAVPASVVAAGAAPVAAAPVPAAPAPAVAEKPAAASVSSGGGLPWLNGPHATPHAGGSAGSGLPWERGSAGTPAAAVPAAVAAPASHPVSSAPAQPASAAPIAERASVPAADASPVESVVPQAAPVSAKPAAVDTTTDGGELQRTWAEVVRRLVAVRPQRGALLGSARAQADDGSTLTVGLPAGSDFAMRMLARADAKEAVEAMVAEVFGPRTVEFTMPGAPASSPAAPAQPAVPAQPKAAAPSPAPAPAPMTSAPAAPAPAAAAQPSKPAPAKSAPAAPHRPGALPWEAPASAAPAAPAPAPAPQPEAPVPTPSAPAAEKPAFVPFAQDAAAPATGDELPPWESGEPASSAPAEPAVDHTSGPTIVPEPDVDAQRAAWESEQVPYDDATIAAYEDGAAPADVPVPEPASSAADAPAPPAALGAMPWAGAAAAPADDIPQTEQEAKALLGEVFGTGVIFKPAE